MQKIINKIAEAKVLLQKNVNIQEIKSEFNESGTSPKSVFRKQRGRTSSNDRTIQETIHKLH